MALARVDAAASAAAHEEAAYYRAIEEHFVSRRGDPLFLANADWLLIRKWRKAGVPLRVVLRGITDALDGHAHSWGRKRRVGSLAYCAAEVESARDRWQRALSFEGEAQSGMAGALEGFAAALDHATGLGARGTRIARDTAKGLRELNKEAGASPRQVSAALVRAERELVEVLRGEADAGVLAAIEHSIEHDLQPYRARMPARVLEQIRDEARIRGVLARHGLPRLSLFHL